MIRLRKAKPILLIAGGGTAGHLIPGLAVAEALVKAGWPREDIRFMGSERGVEQLMVPQAGFHLTTFQGRGYNRRQVSFQNLKNLLKLTVGISKGVWSVYRINPAAVLCLGGYAALPASIGAVIKSTPLIISEQNAAASATNRLLARFAKVSAVPTVGTGLVREVATGNPVRELVHEAKGNRNKTRTKRGWPESIQVVVIFGGSLGATSLNSAVWAASDQIAERPNVLFYHVVGERDWEERPEIPTENYVAVQYDHDLPNSLGAADFAICRAGGSTVAELQILQIPCLLIPLPFAPNNHQQRNAEMLEKIGTGKILQDAALDSVALITEIDRGLGADPQQKKQLIDEKVPPNAAKAVSELIVRHALEIPADLDREAFGSD